GLAHGARELPRGPLRERHRHQRGDECRALSARQGRSRRTAGGSEMERLRRRGSADIQRHVIRSRPSCLAAGRPSSKRPSGAVRELGLKGIFIHSSHKGHYPDDDEARPLWGLVEALDGAVMIHPPHLGFGEERMKDYRLASSIGRPFDLCLALGRLIVRGILEDFPRVTIVASHGGGGICETISRMDYAYELQEEA